MGRIRTIKPEFFTDEELSALEPEIHLFAAGLLCYADDEGFFNANPGLVKASVTPLREPSVSIHGMLTRLSEIGFIRLGESSDGKRWGHIVKFAIHQRVNRPTPSKIKDLPIVWERSVRTHTQLSEDSLPERKGKEGKGKGREGNDAPSPRSEAPPDQTAKQGPGFLTDDVGSELALANHLLEEAGVVADNGVRKVCAEAIRLLAKEGGTLLTAHDYILDAALRCRSSGEVINRFWFTDQLYRPKKEKRDIYQEFLEAEA